jgi:hypothetical protein
MTSEQHAVVEEEVNDEIRFEAGVGLTSIHLRKMTLLKTLLSDTQLTRGKLSVSSIFFQYEVSSLSVEIVSTEFVSLVLSDGN